MSLHSDIIKKGSQLAVTHGERYKHVAFVVQRNKVICYGRNVRVDHPTIYARYMEGIDETVYTLHAEYVAVNNAMRHPKFNKKRNFYVVVLRFNNELRLMNSMPCLICQNYLARFNCTKVLYSVESAIDVDGNDIYDQLFTLLIRK